jgi:glycosyltransferase involved in cell wall biosynthesis
METITVLMATTASVLQIHGGPALTPHLLLRAAGTNQEHALSLGAVFCDGVVPPGTAVSFPVGDRGSRPILLSRPHFPPGLYAAIRLLSSATLCTYNLNRAVGWLDSRPLILHTHDFMMAYIAGLRYRGRVPLVLTVHYKGGWAREVLLQYPRLRGTLIARSLMRIENRGVELADVVVFTSEGSRELFEREHPGLLARKDVRIVHTGVDTDELDGILVDSSVLPRYGVDPGRSIILYVGPLISDKGADVLVEAFASMPRDIVSELVCLIVGRGDLDAALRSRIDKAGLTQSVRFFGFLPRDDLLQIIKASTLFVLPSRVSVFDYALLEAGALGVPIVTTSVGGNVEMFDEKSAMFVPPENPIPLGAAISHLVRRPEIRRQLAMCGRERIRSLFSLDKMLEGYSAIYRELLQSRIAARLH